MAELSTRYNLPANVTEKSINLDLNSTARWIKEPSVGGWTVKWGNFVFHIPNTGMTLLHHLKSNFVVPEWQQTRNLFSHLFKNPKSTIIEPFLALRILLGVALKDQELQQSLIPGFRSIVHMLSEWLLLEVTSAIHISPNLLGIYLTSDMFKILMAGVKNFFNKMFTLHVVNDHGKPSSIEIKLTGQQIIVTRVNMGFLVEVRRIDIEPCCGETVLSESVVFGLVAEAVLREHSQMEKGQPLNLTQYMNSKIAI
uniref:Membrane-associated protein VP24 n=1 Tax=Orthomarburgvirus marburgense TaxID=3052505 RepID=R4QGQ6_9MONO|nr:viral protein 24 [Orthomarburgvirus marburgense]AGL73420.1 viral protein 24 [Orthomarburgvirus marburgense]